MRHDIMQVTSKHIAELFQILSQYEVTDKQGLVAKSDADIVFQKAVLMSVGYIGELSKKMDDTVKTANPHINWRRLGTSRNIIFHEYDIVDMDIISSVIFRDISALLTIVTN